MLIPAGLLVFVVLSFVALLFAAAYWTERAQSARAKRIITSPVIYTLSMAVYCTSWTFYGAVGSASRNGLEYLAIYLGPSLVFFAWWFGLRKILTIAKIHRITSIADFISSRFGKSGRLSAVVTLIAIVAITPYIALQLKAVTTSFNLLVGASSSSAIFSLFVDSGFWIALILAAFAILFGTSRVGVDEQHAGVVAAIAIESILKLIALLAVGLFVVFGIAGGIGPLFTSEATAPYISEFSRANEDFAARWLTMLILAASAIICLPRQFQVSIVEAKDVSQLRTAAWLFPLYLFLISLSVIPIAVVGQAYLPEGSDPDQFVLSLPLAENQATLTVLAFLGGFSSATSMVIVSSVALSIMISNHLIVPLMLRSSPVVRHRDNTLSAQIIFVRRASILAIIALGYVYYRVSPGNVGLASIGLISFSGVAQFLPPLLIGLFWRNASKQGAMAGLIAGTTVWTYCLLLPSLGSFRGLPLPGFHAQHLFGIRGMDPLVHATFWSLLANTLALIVVSILSHRSSIERIQAALFVDVFRFPTGSLPQQVFTGAASDDLYIIAQRILGHERAYHLFYQAADGDNPPREASAEFVGKLERELAANVGAASARTLISHVTRGELVGIEEVIDILDETQQVHQYSQQLERQSKQLAQTAQQLRTANQQLKALDQQKDDFLSSVSHELRTPMTSIRSFSEILGSDENLSEVERRSFLEIIAGESERLTRLLDKILDLSRLEGGAGDLSSGPVHPDQSLNKASSSLTGLARRAGAHIKTRNRRTAHLSVNADADGLQQVFVNLISNALKYNDNPKPQITITTRIEGPHYQAIIADNGPGIAEDQLEHIFSKFGRNWRTKGKEPSGTGLGLAISRQIVAEFNGELTVRSNVGKGSEFIVTLPLAST